MKPEAILDCAGKAKRRRRFRLKQDFDAACQSGVALRLPPQSTMGCWLALVLLSTVVSLAQTTPVTLHLIGDSTMTYQPTCHLNLKTSRESPPARAK